MNPSEAEARTQLVRDYSHFKFEAMVAVLNGVRGSCPRGHLRIRQEIPGYPGVYLALLVTACDGERVTTIEPEGGSLWPKGPRWAQ